MTSETAPLWILAWITLLLLALGTAMATRAWVRRRGALAGVTGLFALGLARQIGLIFGGAGGPFAFDARTGAEFAFLGMTIAGFVALHAIQSTTRERDRAEDLHWDSMETVRMMTELASGPGSDFQTRLTTLLALGAERFQLEQGVAWSIEGEGRAIAVHPPAPKSTKDRLSTDLLGRAASSERPLALIDASTPQPRAFFGASVRSGGRIFGSLAFEGAGKSALRFTATEKDLLNLMAQWLATELERSERAAAVERAAMGGAPPRRPIRRTSRDDLNAAVRYSEVKLRRRLGAEATLELHLDPAIPDTRPTRVALPTLAESLVDAAVRLAPTGRIRLETRALTGRGTASDPGPDFVTLEVRVESPAVDERALQRILETGDEEREHVGAQTLSVSRLERLLRRGGGDLSVSLEPRRRATFTAFLPATLRVGTSPAPGSKRKAAAAAGPQPS